MKIAVVTDADGRISQHFGRASQYRVFTVEDGQIATSELREKPGHDQFVHLHEHDHSHDHGHDHDHQHGTGPQADDKHARMVAAIRDCEAVIVGGMGYGGYRAMEQAGIRPFITDMADAEAAVKAYIDGALEDHSELLH